MRDWLLRLRHAICGCLMSDCYVARKGSMRPIIICSRCGAGDDYWADE